LARASTASVGEGLMRPTRAERRIVDKTFLAQLGLTLR